MQSKTDRRVNPSPLGWRQKSDPRNADMIAVVPSRQFSRAQSTCRHAAPAPRHWPCRTPRKSFRIDARAPPTSANRWSRRRPRTNRCHSTISDADLGWNIVG
ncbi:hypothetical protein RHMOL_Rhmol10G0135800 [Rhododendron molle]|uniref:Uncharacterized protein n=1 Tax=Rhododendron molle TaxID=49168 RepID=A0ACC0M1R7_RHOML|nr:hypothetical protein RHMOL_Rhmol10G0135800 [Rhododendron molle]